VRAQPGCFRVMGGTSLVPPAMNAGIASCDKSAMPAALATLAQGACFGATANVWNVFAERSRQIDSVYSDAGQSHDAVQVLKGLIRQADEKPLIYRRLPRNAVEREIRVIDTRLHNANQGRACSGSEPLKIEASAEPGK
jgi:hypothetical protein